MIADTEAGKIDVILAYSNSRLPCDLGILRT
jgi:hypothetical protein